MSNVDNEPRNNLYELKGEVEQIIFRNEKNGYTVLNIVSNDELITAVGIMPLVNVGESLNLFGKWSKHPNFGEQFQVETFERFMPSGAEAIFKYLSSGVIKGVGPAIAKKIVDEFGDRTFDIIENEPEKLKDIKGITKSKAMKIAKEFSNIFGIREIMIYLGKFGILPEEAIKIWKLCGNESIENIKEDPYFICNEPICIDFNKAEEISVSLEKPKDDVCRIRAGVLHILRHNMGNGHTCLPIDKLVEVTASFLEVKKEQVEETIEFMKEGDMLISDIMYDKQFLFLPNMNECERYIANRLKIMLGYPPQSIKNAEREIENVEKKFNVKYAQLQKKAIYESINKGLLVLTGGPGTGKTTALNGIIDILESNGERVYLAAPTGRAAQRISEVTGKNAKTIHRLLEFEWTSDDKQIFARNEKRLLDCDTLILDELSMVDSFLFEAVLKALPLGCRLIMVGDCDQLPSVGVGNILGDLIDCGIIPVVQLKEIFRQSMESLIITNSHKIVNGEMPDLTVKNSDFFFIDINNPTDISKTIVDLYSKRLPKAYGYSPFSDIQVLCPSRKGELGTHEINKKLQEVINPKSVNKKEVSLNGITFREGDKVMQARNNYDIMWQKDDGTTGEGVFNGDTGILLKVDKKASLFYVRFDDKVAVYDIENISDIELSYAITIHKSQGSEFKAVIMPMFPGPKSLYYRNLLYTGVTRAKSIIVMVGLKKTVKTMVDNAKKTRRYSALCYFLINDDKDDI